jgi:hypothetical protein
MNLIYTNLDKSFGRVVTSMVRRVLKDLVDSLYDCFWYDSSCRASIIVR